MIKNVQAMTGFFKEKKNMGPGAERRISGKPEYKPRSIIRVTMSGETLKDILVEAAQETDRLSTISQLVLSQK